jgi:hypothetical protein
LRHTSDAVMIVRSLSFVGLGLFVLLAWTFPRKHNNTAPLSRRAYVWQREWTPAVGTAMNQAAPHLDAFIVLGAEVAWKNGEPHVLRPPVDWVAVRTAGKPLGIALRIDPCDPIARKDRVPLFVELARSLVAEAQKNGVPCTEFQVDFDCATSKLAAYRAWLPALQDAVKPARFVITTLPSWLGYPEMSRLVAGVDGFVLQVHSVPTRVENERVAIFDTARAQRWIDQAAALGRPFTVSLPTYSALLGYDRDGRYLGMALDGVQPAWPAGTRVVECNSDPVELARLVAEWRTSHPATMDGVVWYRLPISSAKRNWRWPTLAAVLEGRTPTHQLTVHTEGENPVDLSLANQGEAEESLDATVCVRWNGPANVVAEALRGWTVSQTAHEARFTRTEETIPRLLPGSRRDIGWLRFDQPTQPYAEIIR